MKRRFRSYDYSEDCTDAGVPYVMNLRIRDRQTLVTYYAECIIGIDFAHGGYFYDTNQEPIDDNSVPAALRAYAEHAFDWRNTQRMEQHVQLLSVRNSQAASADSEDGTTGVSLA